MAETKEQVMHTPYVVLHTGVDFSILDERGLAVATVAQDKIAELIVRAVNCHEELLAQLISARGFIPKNQPVVRNNVNAAIAKAEGR